MPHYRVEVHGSNYWMTVEGRPKRVGFTATRNVHARDRAGASAAALERVEREARARQLTSLPDDPGRLEVGEIEEVELGDEPSYRTKLALYQDEAEDVA